MTLADAGVERVGVVVGFRRDLICSALDSELDYVRRNIQIDVIDNPEYEKSNGLSVLAARPSFDGPFLLSMADHVYDQSLAETAAGADMATADLHLCVDYRIDEIYDMPDATKVVTEEKRIVRIGKELEDFDCVDCGVFAVSPALFDELEAVRREQGDCSLSNGVEGLARRGRARVLDIGDAFWQDVDTVGARVRAEQVLASQAQPIAVPVAQISEARQSTRSS